MKQNADSNENAPDFLKNFLRAYIEEQKEGDINEFIKKNELAEYNAIQKKDVSMLISPEKDEDLGQNVNFEDKFPTA